MTADGALAVTFRAVHLLALALAAGGLAFVWLVARPGRTGIDRTALVLARVALGVAVLALAGEAALRLAEAAGRPLLEATRAGLWRPLLVDTWYGRVVVARLLLAALSAVLLAPPLAARWPSRPWLVGAAASAAALLLATGPLGGHAISAESAALRAWQATAGVLHALAAGVWLGALPMLALALRKARSRDEADRLARRFSGLGLASVSLLVATGLASAYALVGSVAGLVGTPYGRLLVAKVALFVAVLAIAARNLLGPRIGLTRRVVVEAALGAAILVLAAALASTPPARHVEPVWPFTVRLTGAILARAPTLASRVQSGVLVALFGLSALVFAALFPRQRRIALGAGVAALAIAWFAIWPLRDFLVIDAYPTTYARPAVPYDVASLSAGLELFSHHCAPCHGAEGRGDGPAGRGLPVPPADLTAEHAKDHTAGDLFWWITYGMRQAGQPAPTMPGFGTQLDEEARWDLVNTVRLLSDSAAAAALSPEPAPTPGIVAPDFAHPALPGGAGTLRSARGRVVVVVIGAPGETDASATRLAALADRIAAAGGLLVLVDPRRAPDVAAVYGRFRPPADAGGPVAFLVDRAGYLRARWGPGDLSGPDGADRLVALVERLSAEPPAPPAEAHVH
ncbi:MAG TPA: CopD family protein [Thermodesulfobacteriota bacterium]